MPHLFASFVFVCLVSLTAARASAAGPPDFSRDILPILSDNCFQCHGPDANARQADLRLDQKSGALRTENRVIVPGDSANSPLFERITTDDEFLKMPPADSNRTLKPEEIALLKRWIDGGAEWGKHWAFVAPVRPALPEVKHTDWPRNPIDRFVLDRLEREGLAPAPEADRETLIRRVTLDLTGLPPTLEEIDAFLADRSPTAYEKVVDRLFQSPRYGERMVWNWLDAARYADTNGYQGDPTRPMYFWRDWVIEALNQNMPFDQFTIEQLAGDLLPDPKRDQLIATGFHRNHMINGEGGRIAEESRVNYVQDRVETTGTVWMGLTFNCCRCHDHKYDPLKQSEYYQLSAYFNSIDETGRNDARGLAHPIMTLSTPEQEQQLAELKTAESQARQQQNEAAAQLRAGLAAWEKSLRAGEGELRQPGGQALPEDVQAILARPAGKRTDEQKQRLLAFVAESDPRVDETQQQSAEAKKQAAAATKRREKFERSLPKTMVMRDRQEPRKTYILIRGAYDNYGQPVSHGVPEVLPPLPEDAPPNRLALARWLVDPDHPLTARVTVNRYWQRFFGTGLVKTTGNFGIQGEKPSHPELLDWLAREFMQPTVDQPTVVNSHPDNTWNVDHIMRLIVTSAAYRQSSRVTADLLRRDPDNRLLARGPRYRLPSWMIRDQALAASGLLVEKLGGPPVKGYQPAGIWEEATFGKIQYQRDDGAALYRRSLYQFWRRIVGPTMFFDVASRQTCTVKLARTNTPLHALITLNDVTYVEAARALAQRVLLGPAEDDAARITEAFRRLTARRPRPEELNLLLHRLDVLRKHYRQHPATAKKLIAVGESEPDETIEPGELAAYAGIATVILNLDETISKE